MKVKYSGPRDSINVGEFGPHAKDQVKDYPKEVAEELVETANKQSFEIAEKKTEPGKGKK